MLRDKSVMRVAIDGTPPVVGGGVTWLRELVPALCAASPEDSFWLFLRSDMQGLNIRVPTNCRIVWIKLPKRIRTMWRIAWQQLVLPMRLWKMKIDVLLCPYDIASLLAPCKVVLGIQNANPYYGSRAGTWLGRRREQCLKWLTKLSAWRAARVFFVSESSREVISHKLGLPFYKSSVIHHGVGERFHRKEDLVSGEVTGGYVLVVGSIRSHKDYDTLIRAWERIPRAANASLQLLIVGPVLEWGYHDELMLLVNQLGISGSILFVGEVSHDELPKFYRNAVAVVFPSSAEVFGLPLVEAMACGVPVVASDIAVAREVCGEAAIYYRLGDVADLCSKLTEVLRNGHLRRQLVEHGRCRINNFSWRKAGLGILQLIHEAVGNPIVRTWADEKSP